MFLDAATPASRTLNSVVHLKLIASRSLSAMGISQFASLFVFLDACSASSAVPTSHRTVFCRPLVRSMIDGGLRPQL